MKTDALTQLLQSTLNTNSLILTVTELKIGGIHVLTNLKITMII